MKSFSTKLPFLALLGIAFATGTQAQDLAALTPKTSQTTIQQAEPVSKYTGYWFVKSGDELILVKEGNLPPGLVRKSSQYQVESMDIESVKKQLNFKHESQHNGRYVERDVFVIADESGSVDMGSVTPTSNRGSGVQLFSSKLKDSYCDYLFRSGTNENPLYPSATLETRYAVEECFYPGPCVTKRQGYRVVSTDKCTNGATYSAAMKQSSGRVVYVFCSQTN